MDINTPTVTDPNAAANPLSLPLPPGNPLEASGGGGAIYTRQNPVDPRNSKDLGLTGGGGNPLKMPALPKQTAEKPSFAGVETPTFQDYVPFLAKQDGKDLQSLTDQDIIGYSGKYNQQFLPQKLLAAGHKVDKSYLSSLDNSLQYGVAKNIDQYRKFWKDRYGDESTAPPDGSSDFTKEAKADVVGGMGSAVGGITGWLGDAAKNLATYQSPLATIGDAIVKQTTGHNLNITDPVQRTMHDLGDRISGWFADKASGIRSGESAGFKADAAQPMFKPGVDLLKPDGGGVNLDAFNPDWLNKAAIFKSTVGNLINAAPALLLLATTKNPELANSVFSAQGMQDARDTTKEQFKEYSQNDFEKMPAYQAKVANNVSPEDAKQQIQDEAVAYNSSLGALSGYAGGKIAGSSFFKPASGKLLTKIATNYAKQAPAFAALAGAQKVAENAAANKATGQANPLMAGAGEAAAQSAVGAAPFSVLGAITHGKEATQGKGGTDIPVNNPSESDVNGAAPGTPPPPEAVQSSIAFAFENHPINKDELTNVAAQQQHYEQASEAFKGSLFSDLSGTEEQKEATAQQAMPQFDAAWKAQTGVDPAQFRPAPPAPVAGEATADAPTAEELTAAAAQAPPAEEGGSTSSVAAQPPFEGAPASLAEPEPDLSVAGLGKAPEEAPASAREALAEHSIPPSLAEKVGQDIATDKGRDATPAEVAQQGQHLIDILSKSDGVDPSLPRDKVVEAIGKWFEKSKEMPSGDDITKLANEESPNPLKSKPRIKLKTKEENPLKKAEAAQDETAAHDEGQEPEGAQENKDTVSRYEATPDERNKWEGMEKYVRRFNNVHDLLSDMVGRLQDSNLKNLVTKILSNPVTREKLKGDKVSIINPGDVRSGAVRTSIGPHSQGFVRGLFHTTRGLQLSGAGWKQVGSQHGLHAITIVHEALHATLQHIIEGVKSGKITDLSVIAAHQELEHIRGALESILPSLKDTVDTATYNRVKYAASSTHELTSVAMTEPKVQGVLRNIKMGALSVYHELLRAWNKMIGGKNDDVPAMDRVVSATNTLLDYKGENAGGGAGEHADEVESYSKENTAEKTLERIRVGSPSEAAKAETLATTKPSLIATIARKLLDENKPIQELQEGMRRHGITIDPKNDLLSAAQRFQSEASREVQKAQLKYVQPAVNAIADLAKKAGMDPNTFMTNLSARYMGQRALEINERGELETARFSEQGQKQRAQITRDWSEGKLPEGQYIEALRKLYKTDGVRVGSRAPSTKSGISDAVAYQLIAQSKKGGITPEVISAFELHRKAMVQAIEDNYQKSKKFSSYDKARVSGLASKWYLPFKGLGEDGIDTNYKGEFQQFAQQYRSAKGRSTIPDNGIVKLFQEVAASAKDGAQNKFTGTLFNFNKAYGKQLGWKTNTLNVEKETQDKLAAGKSFETGQILKQPNSVIHNSGSYRHAIQIPEGAGVFEAINKLGSTPEIDGIFKAWGHVTNLISRGATTLNPKFLLWNAIFRDSGYVGMQLYQDKGAEAVTRYIANYWLHGGPMRGRGTYFKGISEGFAPRNALEREEYAQVSGSKFAQSLQEMAEAGGDLSFDQQLNHVSNMQSVETMLRKASGESTIGEKFQAVEAYLDQIGTSDIMTARVAAYEVMRDMAIEALDKDATPEQIQQAKSDAAMFSRRLLDYQQRSEWGRALNLVFPFAKVALTQADRLAQSFKNPDGSYDFKKMGITAGVGMMAGFMLYTLSRQANPDIKKQENSTLSSNFLIPFNGKIIKIPMAYGLTRLMLVPGMMVARAYYGDISNEDAANTVRNVVSESLTPLKLPEAGHNERIEDEKNDFLEAFVPGSIRPLVELGRNQSFTGGKISRDVDRGSHSNAGKTNTPELWKWMAKSLNTVTGGGVDVYPESLEYITSAYGTGIANGVLRAIATWERSSRGEESRLDQLPFVPSVFSHDADYHTSNALQEKKDDIMRKEAPSDNEKEQLKQINALSRGYFKKLDAATPSQRKSMQEDHQRQQENLLKSIEK